MLAIVGVIAGIAVASGGGASPKTGATPSPSPTKTAKHRWEAVACTATSKAGLSTCSSDLKSKGFKGFKTESDKATATTTWEKQRNAKTKKRATREVNKLQKAGFTTAAVEDESSE
jgi:hypothetical protein